MRNAIIVFFLIVAAALGQPQTASPKPVALSQAKPGSVPVKAAPKPAPKPAPAPLPSKAQIDAALQRSFGYDPAITWNVLDVRASSIPGVAEAQVSMNRQPPVHVFMSPDQQVAIIGEVIPFGPNPFLPAREKLKAADGPQKGAQQPAIILVDFSDLQCPHCKAAQPIVEKLVTDFPNLKLIFQQFPLPASLHPWAMKAAQYTDCAGRMNPDAFWKYVDLVFENQGSIALVTADSKLSELAASAGLDAGKVAACAAAPETAERIRKSLELGQSLDVTQTPTLFINGRRVLGAADIPYEQLKSLVQFEIDHGNR